jgi:hypothetical protein
MASGFNLRRIASKVAMRRPSAERGAPADLTYDPRLYHAALCATSTESDARHPRPLVVLCAQRACSVDRRPSRAAGTRADANGCHRRGWPRLGGRPLSRRGASRQVTLLQAEDLTVIGALLDAGAPTPAVLRRNLTISGINLLALKGRRFQIGEAVLEGSGLCHPCSRMEEVLGLGGYNAMRGHGGLTAGIVRSGRIALGDAVVELGPAKGGTGAGNGECYATVGHAERAAPGAGASAVGRRRSGPAFSCRVDRAQEYRFLLIASSLVTETAPCSHRVIEFRCH